ncbi:hypothetical protein ERW51_17750 [Aliivibrio finisterrensis]|nr:hypothetical protein ERW51_17750 [Aliivibrio finisterrensis]
MKSSSDILLFIPTGINIRVTALALILDIVISKLPSGECISFPSSIFKALETIIDGIDIDSGSIIFSPSTVLFV